MDRSRIVESWTVTACALLWGALWLAGAGGCDSPGATWPGWVEPARPALLMHRGACPAGGTLSLTLPRWPEYRVEGLAHGDCIELGDVGLAAGAQAWCDDTGLGSEPGARAYSGVGGCARVTARVP